MKRVMKRVMVKSVFDAFEYVMEHYHPAGMEDEVERSDSYAVISIQDTHTGGFGLKFAKSKCCKDVLTLYFDDIYKNVDGYVLFDEQMANAIIDFIIKNRGRVETLLVHCYAGRSRSKAVGAFAVSMLGGDNYKYFATSSPNLYVYDLLMKCWNERLEK